MDDIPHFDCAGLQRKEKWFEKVFLNYIFSTFLDPKFDPVNEVLEPIHQFIVQFLSCEVCSKNFDKMAREDGLLNVHKPGLFNILENK